MWPAFWKSSELNIELPPGLARDAAKIDIMENDIGRTPDTNYGTTHGPGPGSYPGDGLSGAFNAGSPLGSAFHVYATEWSASSVSFYVDGSLFTWTVTPSQLPAGAAMGVGLTVLHPPQLRGWRKLAGFARRDIVVPAADADRLRSGCISTG